MKLLLLLTLALASCTPLTVSQLRKLRVCEETKGFHIVIGLRTNLTQRDRVAVCAIRVGTNSVPMEGVLVTATDLGEFLFEESSHDRYTKECTFARYLLGEMGEVK